MPETPCTTSILLPNDGPSRDMITGTWDRKGVLRRMVIFGVIRCPKTHSLLFSSAREDRSRKSLIMASINCVFTRLLRGTPSLRPRQITSLVSSIPIYWLALSYFNFLYLFDRIIDHTVLSISPCGTGVMIDRLPTYMYKAFRSLMKINLVIALQQEGCCYCLGCLFWNCFMSGFNFLVLFLTVSKDYLTRNPSLSNNFSRTYYSYVLYSPLQEIIYIVSQWIKSVKMLSNASCFYSLQEHTCTVY